jgi:hypothetical protein
MGTDIKEKLTFYHDRKFNKPFNLFEDIQMRDSEISIEKGKIKPGGLRWRKFETIVTSSGMGELTIHGYFMCDNIKYYFKCESKRIPERNDEDSVEPPYLEVACIEKKYNPNFGDNKKCKCGHAYYRHFDTYEQMEAVGCKYCDCYTFEEAK